MASTGPQNRRKNNNTWQLTPCVETRGSYFKACMLKLFLPETN